MNNQLPNKKEDDIKDSHEDKLSLDNNNLDNNIRRSKNIISNIINMLILS